MQRVSVRTLVLMMLLLGYVLAHQHLGCAATAGPHVMWLLADPNDPNEPDPIPEYAGCALPTTACDTDPNDPNEPDPMPELI